MDFANKIMETHQRMLGENKFLTEDKLNESYEVFAKNFDPDKLKGLDGEPLLETLFNHGNKGSLVYWLEFKNDDEFQTNRFGGIAGGSAFKFGLYKRKEDGRWITGSPKDVKELDLASAIELAREKRDLLVKGAELIKAIPVDYEDTIYLILQEDIDKELGNLSNLGWVHKYYHMLYPDKIDDFHSYHFQSFYLIKMLEKPIKSEGRYALAGQYMRLANQFKMRVNEFTGVLLELFGPLHRYWRVGTTRNSDKQSYWSLMLKGGYVAIGWPAIGDLHTIEDQTISETKESLKKVLAVNHPNTPQIIGRAANQIYAFYQEIKQNDIIVASEGQKVLGIGKVIGDYEYRVELDFPHCINVQWIVGPSDKLPKPNEGLLTTVNQFKDIDNLLEIEKLIGDSVNFKAAIKTPKVLESLIGIIGKVEGILNRKKQVIIYGPPGTGKTFWAERACLELASRKAFKKSFDEINDIEKTELFGNSDYKGLVRSCCFHPSYGYEDFIEGIKPSVIDRQTVFDLKAGIFKIMCEDAKNNPAKNYYLLIDEINRGDISRIFGELISIVEAGKRGKGMILPLSGESFSVPDNVYIVGTMNTADRSIALLDVALRRRFGFFELMPDYSILAAVTIENLPLGLWLSELNRRIIENVGRDARNLQIGHSYFMDKGMPIKDFDKLRKVIEEDIIPLLEEYCYGDYLTIVKIIGSSFVDTTKQEINHKLFRTANKSDLIAALMELSPEIATSSVIQQTADEEEQGVEEEDADGVKDV